MKVTRSFLFVGGPLHATTQPLEPVGWSVPSALPAPLVDVLKAEPIVAVEDFPLVHTHLKSATNYMRRTVAHVTNDGHGPGYTLAVYVAETLDMQQAPMMLGDAVMHRYFIEHGDMMEAPPAPPKNNGRPSGLIVPGQ